MANGTRRPDGYLERGEKVTRLEAFIDAAFAFAVTLLVISLDEIPDSGESLLTAVKGVPAYGASFVLIALVWNAHHTWSRRFGLDDRATMLLGLFLVFQVLVYVYPLKMLFGSLFFWLSGGYLPSGFKLKSVDDLRVMFTVYGLAWTTLGATIMSLYLLARRRADAIGLDTAERAKVEGEIAAWSLAPLTGLASLAVIALLEWSNRTDGWLFALPGLVYSLMALAYPVALLAERRAARRFGIAAP